MTTVLIIGAGAAGMMAAIAAADEGAEVILLEKKPRPGRKLAITGKGRCNLTSSAELDEFIKSYPRNGRFMFSSLNQLSNLDLIKFFNGQGLATKVERGKRVFPVSDSAEQVVNTLTECLKGKKVKLILDTQVTGIKEQNGKIGAVLSSAGEFRADAVVIATGGMSYPGTGSTGDGYKWAEALGHTIVPPRPGLIPLLTAEEWVKELQGLSLKNVKLTAYRANGKKINEDFGEMLFTHFGISGPIVLSMSRDIVEYMYKKNENVLLTLDWKPALDEEKLDERLKRDLLKNGRKKFKNSLDDLLPAKMIPIFITLSGIDADKECHSITKTERLHMLHLLKKMTMTVNGCRPIKEAIVTSGGVNVKEVDPGTLASKIINNLFFAGEILDVDGYTGGFNLQAAFSTGWVAGKNAARSISKTPNG